MASELEDLRNDVVIQRGKLADMMGRADALLARTPEDSPDRAHARYLVACLEGALDALAVDESADGRPADGSEDLVAYGD
ncbi:hypothetical protein CKO28_18735 [Rhodovibrio sodomensis]|uniref:Uncharacterized protein n=1 Tax=Rhodovibrio sodomensis TaxID=1088 RepID=A0ABS1DHX1_9PROT|nr:hypothetical protein [Rhodovibrio sodomensis]MBK1670075.1 hypothetical protein [Rhodovibrio sodomensis]